MIVSGWLGQVHQFELNNLFYIRFQFWQNPALTVIALTLASFLISVYGFYVTVRELHPQALTTSPPPHLSLSLSHWLRSGPLPRRVTLTLTLIGSGLELCYGVSLHGYYHDHRGERGFHPR